MYKDFFKFSKKPFDLAPNPEFLYLSRSHKKALTYLDYALKEKAGFVLLTGEVGTGKTTLIRDFISKLDGNIAVSRVFNTKVSSEQLLAMVNDDFGLDVKGKDKVNLLKDLNNFLIEEFEKRRYGLLVIDEAQNLTPELLEEVRLLSNLETGEVKLLQIIMVGQPELADVLSQFELRQLRQRISIVCHLYPLSRGETEEYIAHRLAVAGNKDAVKFSREAMEGIYAYSRGIPRLVNVICNFLLLTAFTEGTREVDRKVVDDIINDLSSETRNAGNNHLDDGNRALLNALGVSPKLAPAVAGAMAGNEQLLEEKRLNVVLKEISLRLDVIEKEMSKLRGVDLSGIAGRLEQLERRWRKPDNERMGSLPLASSATPALGAEVTAAAEDCSEQEPQKAGLWHRIFGA